MNSMMNNFMSDPFGQSIFGQQQQQQQQNNRQNNNNNNNRSNQVGWRNNNNNFDPFGQMSPFDMHHNSLMAHHQQAMNNPFALMNQMMSGGFSNNIFNSMVEIFQKIYKILFFLIKKFLFQINY